MSRAARRGPSLRWRLTLISGALVAVALAVGAVVLTGIISASRVGALDQIARERAVAVGRLVESGQLPEVIPVSEPGEVAQVLGAGGAVVATSANASRTLPVLPAEEVAVRVPSDAGRDAPTSWTTAADPYADTARVAALRVASSEGPVTVVVGLPLSDVEGVVRALRVALWGVVPTVTLLVGFVVWWTTGRALRPVEELRVAAEGVVESGGGHLPTPARDDEIGALARTLDAMLDRLRAASQRQRAFVADAAHELRSPLAVLRATVDVAAAYPETYTVTEMVDQTGIQVDRLERLVDDLLVLARIGSHPRASEEVDLAQVVRSVVAAEEAGSPSQIAVTVAGEGRALAEPEAVARIVRNLVANARRHAQAAVQVTIADGIVTVADDGPGIPVPERERVFERFTRLDDARDRGDGGSGLGLAIARETATELAGSVILGDAEAGGLSVQLTLPIPTTP